MTYKDIQESLGTLARLTAELEDQYIESEGEVTPEAEAVEAEIEAVKHLLENDGIDALGRWLKMKEDEAKMWKAEKAAADRKMKSALNTVDFVKAKIAEVMTLTGTDKAKGVYYGFTKYVSEKSVVDYEEIKRIWGPLVNAALEGIGLPTCLEVEFKTTTGALKEAGEDEFVQTTTADAVRFTKPRKAKED